MPDHDGATKAGENIPNTPLHAYKEGREDDVKGDTQKLNSNDPKDQRQSEIEDKDEPKLYKK